MQNINSIVRIIVVLILLSTNGMAQKPEPRWLHQMIYDESNKQVLLFGGANENGILKDLWSLKKYAWKKLSGDGPQGGIKAAFAYDAYRKCAVLFGGAGEGNKALDETWEWNGENWKKINIAGPSGRIHAMASYDPKNKVIIIFGGFGDAGQLSDTWIYNGKLWIQKDLKGPKNCVPHGMFYDETKEKIILITLTAVTAPDASHVKNEMWEWTGDSWKNISYGTLYTRSGNLQALAPSGDGNIILFDGDDTLQTNGKTWKFFKDTWSGAFLPGPSYRIGEGMVYDSFERITILFGGGNRKDIFNDLWKWDGKEWHKIN
jgi:hypothetical protein